MDFFTSILGFFWLIRTLKYVLFWLYLWQLKEYHIPRFIDHFRTEKGKHVVVNFFSVAKVIILMALAANYALGANLFWVFFYVLLALYIAETGVFAVSIIKKQVKLPVFTSKMGLLAICALAILLAFTYIAQTYVANHLWFTGALLAFDILVPVIVSVVVLLWQPLFVLLRLRILKKASKKVATHKNLMVIGITGSYGKTSTKEFLTTILSSKYKVLATPEHKNSEMGIAETILSSLASEHEIFIVEMGAYQKGGIKLLCDMVKPKIGVVTGVNEQHLALFGSLENLLSAEGGRELAAALPDNGVLIVNGENQHCLDLYKKFQGRKKVYALSRSRVEADMFAEEVSVTKTGLSFIARSWHKEMAHVDTVVLGKQQVQNMLGAMLVAREFDISFEQIANACKNITQKQGGMTLSMGLHDIEVIDSSYSSNPDGVMADLDYLSVFGGKKVIVMPCLIELGPKSAEIHEQIGKKIAHVCDMAIITSNDAFEHIKKGAIHEGMSAKNVILLENAHDILHAITIYCSKGDTVLLEGRVPNEVIKLLKS